MRRTIKSLNTQIKEQVLVRYLPPALINDIFEGKVSMDTKAGHPRDHRPLFGLVWIYQDE